MLELKINDHIYHCEGNWNELSRRRLLQVCKAITSPGNEGRRMLLVVKTLLRLYTGKMGILHNPSRKIWNLQPAWIQHIAAEKECLGWIRDEKEILTKYTIKNFWHWGIYYIGPPKRMMRIKMVELVATRQAMVRYKKTGDNQYAAQAIAILYRPINPLWWLKIWNKDWTGDKRMPLNDYTLQKRKKNLLSIDVAVMTAILKQYSGALAQFESRYPNVFATGSNENSDGSGWVDILFNMSGGIFGNLRQTEETDSSEIFLKLEMDIVQNQKQQLKLKK
jgi:hypothetical protein